MRIPPQYCLFASGSLTADVAASTAGTAGDLGGSLFEPNFSDVGLVTEKRMPFAVLTKRLDRKRGREFSGPLNFFSPIDEP
jgi:hypothetical protein